MLKANSVLLVETLALVILSSISNAKSSLATSIPDGRKYTCKLKPYYYS